MATSARTPSFSSSACSASPSVALAAEMWGGRAEPIETLAEGGKLLVGLAQQADLLRTLAGEQQADLLSFERSLREHRPRKELSGGGGRRGSHGVGRAVAALLQGFRAGDQLLAECLERVGHH